MMSRNPISATCLLALLLASPVLVAETGDATTVTTDAATAQPALEAGNIDQVDAGSKEATPGAGTKPNAGTTDSAGTRNSDNRQSVTSAIESFTPTEEISADNAVPFPVDI